MRRFIPPISTFILLRYGREYTVHSYAVQFLSLSVFFEAGKLRGVLQPVVVKKGTEVEGGLKAFFMGVNFFRIIG